MAKISFKRKEKMGCEKGRMLLLPAALCFEKVSPRRSLAKRALKTNVTAPRGAKIITGKYPIEKMVPVRLDKI